MSKALELADVSSLCEQMRRSSIPLADLIPRVQKMADELRRLDAVEQAIKDAEPVAFIAESGEVTKVNRRRQKSQADSIACCYCSFWSEPWRSWRVH